MEIIRAQDVRRGNIATDDTMTTRRGLKVEGQLTNSLVEIVGAIIERVSKAPDSLGLAATVRQDFERPIRDILRAGIETLYNLGATYTNTANNSVAFTTETDIINIKQLTDEAVNVFFGRIVAYITRERERNMTAFLLDFSLTMALYKNFKTRQPLQIEKQIANVVTSIATRAINAGTISKTRQLLQSPNGGVIVTRKASLSDYELDLLESAGSQLSEGTQYELSLAKEVNRARAAELLTEREPPYERPELSYRIKALSPMVIFVTAADDRTCLKICRPLEGETFNINESSTPIPPDSTHLNCRCRLLNIDESGAILLD
jgi:hypothetical protein